MKDYYMILGVKPDASADAIRKAFRHLAKQFHPDCGDGKDESRFREITEAYEALSDPETRKACSGNRFAPHGPDAPPRPRSYRCQNRPVHRMETPASFFHGHADAVRDVRFSDVLRRREYAEPEASQGCLDFEVMLTPKEARFGGAATFPVPFQTPCPACSGTGIEDGWDCPECGGIGRQKIQARITVRIPPGVCAGDVRIFPVNHPRTPFRAVRLFFR